MGERATGSLVLKLEDAEGTAGRIMVERSRRNDNCGQPKKETNANCNGRNTLRLADSSDHRGIFRENLFDEASGLSKI